MYQAGRQTKQSLGSVSTLV